MLFRGKSNCRNAKFHDRWSLSYICGRCYPTGLTVQSINETNRFDAVAKDSPEPTWHVGFTFPRSWGAEHRRALTNRRPRHLERFCGNTEDVFVFLSQRFLSSFGKQDEEKSNKNQTVVKLSSYTCRDLKRSSWFWDVRFERKAHPTARAVAAISQALGMKGQRFNSQYS